VKKKAPTRRKKRTKKKSCRLAEAVAAAEAKQPARGDRIDTAIA
jgi:hypothetical protein